MEFNERPELNERDKALKYVSRLLDKASKDPKGNQKDINELLEVQKLINQKKYGLVWEEHAEKVDKEMETKIPVFIEDKNKRIDNGESKKINFILEGDNLHSLYLLEKTHNHKIDVIYIDPPYNTENEGFTYNDKKVDKNDGYRHSKWISFMQRRLVVAKKLLSRDGIIFISIDDNEYQNLKLLMDEIFGEEKFVTNFIWRRKTGASDAKGIATITEYVLCYCNNPNKKEWNSIFKQNEQSYDEKRYRYKDKYYNERGPFYYDNLDRGGLNYSDSMNFGVKAPDGSIVYPNGRTSFVNDGWIWKWGKDKIKWGFENGFLEFQQSNKKANGWALKYKNYLNVDNSGKLKVRSAPFKNLITSVINQAGTNELKGMFENKTPFSNPKPVELIQFLVSLCNKKDARILDFFAGSGTTGQAVLNLNNKDGGNRTFILATNNENGIAENITYKRLKKLSEGYTTSRKISEIIFQKKLTISSLKNMNVTLDKIEKVIKKNNGKYQKIVKKISDNTIQVIGEYSKGTLMPQIQFNMRYYKTDFVRRDSGNLEMDLLRNVKKLIELGNEMSIKDLHAAIVSRQSEVKKLNLRGIKRVYMRGRVHIMMSPDEKNRYYLSGVQIIDVPESLFGEELQGWI
ncbi:site-specific DNA-methyltransferase [Limosilactobacillus oris]|uniref:site-specific DNA-methyltransferase n=1 Tax=Limosilactobacillus oris TaxID=1632 RepID=UPI0024305D42|nr:site-specific DNA-methyltransferase [Limosilactobacillus oris]